MNGTLHRLVANLSLACLPDAERGILFPRWRGLEAGATLSDDFRIMWEPRSLEDRRRQLVHRCYVDSEDEKDHGCVTRALDHAQGSVSFIKDYLVGDVDGYTELEFLENLAMFLGIACHHIADLCTPVHVGQDMDYARAGSKSAGRFHQRVERDMDRFASRASVSLPSPKVIDLNEEYFWGIARMTYDTTFVRLEDIYAGDDENAKVDLVSVVMSAAVKHTVATWHTVLSTEGMIDREWSVETLV